MSLGRQCICGDSSYTLVPFSVHYLPECKVCNSQSRGQTRLEFLCFSHHWVVLVQMIRQDCCMPVFEKMPCPMHTSDDEELLVETASSLKDDVGCP